MTGKPRSKPKPSSKVQRERSLARRAGQGLIEFGALGSMLSPNRNRDKFRFDLLVRADLARRFPDPLIRSLERVAADYQIKKKLGSDARVVIAAMLRSERRIGAKLDGFVWDLEAAPPSLRHLLTAFESHARAIRDELRSGKGRPAQMLRRELELEVARALDSHDIPLRTSRGGDLAVALQKVVTVVEPSVGMYDPMPVVMRVRKAILEEQRQLGSSPS